ncbi:MAG: hypothetical protein GYA84_05760, partial [Firmicutes bacterium]|nr:hypothetical protein [Bacillota bacterium]
MTEATAQALEGLRDFSTLEWYIIPLLLVVIYIYAKEINKARGTGNWNPIFAALTILGLDFFNETWNGWVMAFSQRSAVWTVPGPTALRVFVGWNIEIILMFSLLGFAYYYLLTENQDKKILGLNEKWFHAILATVLAVFIECILNIGGLLIWEYPWWNLSFAGIWLILLVGYFYFFAGAATVISLKNNRQKITFVSCVYLVPIVMNIIGFG